MFCYKLIYNSLFKYSWNHQFINQLVDWQKITYFDDHLSAFPLNDLNVF